MKRTALTNGRVFMVALGVLAVLLLAGCTHVQESSVEQAVPPALQEPTTPENDKVQKERQTITNEIRKPLRPTAQEETSSAPQLPYSTAEECREFWSSSLEESSSLISLEKGRVVVTFSASTTRDEAEAMMRVYGYRTEVLNPSGASPFFTFRSDDEAYDSLRKLVLLVPEGKEVEVACQVKLDDPIFHAFPDIIVALSGG